ncbi:MAG: EthD domain-containing protein [Candidatus Korobacteraceae bacterium]|jgi:uncharacterized protein (TIGR02118 family)
MMRIRNLLIGTLVVFLYMGFVTETGAAQEKPGSAKDKGTQVRMLKRVSLLAHKQGQTREEFLKHWLEVHAPIAYQIPGIARYTCTVITASSTRKDGPLPIDLEIDGIAEMWFTDQQSLDAARNSPAFAALRADGAAFIGREIDFVTEETVIIPRSK